jgi:hypothetical protein
LPGAPRVHSDFGPKLLEILPQLLAGTIGGG